MVTILITLIVFLCGIFFGASVGIQLVTSHLIQYNRLTASEASYYYSLKNLWDIYMSILK